MDDREKRIERYKQTRLEDVRTNDPICVVCGEMHWNVFERHHVAGCRYCELTLLHCKNCHAKATALQKGHPPRIEGKPTIEEVVGRLLLGLADFFELLIQTFRKYGEQLISQARNAANVAERSAPKPNGAT